MMDPVSIIAGVFSLASAAAQISKAISHLRHSGELPARVYALKNEVSDLEVVLRQVGHGLEQNVLTLGNEPGPLESILVRTKNRLADLGNALERAANVYSGGKFKFISKNAVLLKEKSLLENIQQDIHSAKVTLNLMLGAANS